MSKDGDDTIYLRLPVRRIEAVPEVAQRLRGDVPDSSPGSVIPGGRPGMEGFPWARSQDVDAHADADGDADLTDWQRQWLDLDEADEEADTTTPPPGPGGWWEGIPAIRQLLLDGLGLGPATVFVGENGSGKSTLVEGIAMAYGLAPEGGSTGSQHRSHVSEAGLGDQLAVTRNAGASKFGYFLRAETMHAFFTYLEQNPGNDPNEPLFHQLSHGEAFVALVEVKMKPNWPGLLVLDEPESALSFDNQLRLLRHLQTLVTTGRHQIVMATHSPILAALPGASLYEVDAHGFHEVDHDDATLVRNWRHFMNEPATFLG